MSKCCTVMTMPLVRIAMGVVCKSAPPCPKVIGRRSTCRRIYCQSVSYHCQPALSHWLAATHILLSEVWHGNNSPWYLVLMLNFQVSSYPNDWMWHHFPIWQQHLQNEKKKKLATQDFKDIYYRYFLLVLHHGRHTNYVFKCALPAFVEFRKPHDTTIQHLLFTLVLWHSLAKLCMYTDSTLNHMGFITTQLRHALHQIAPATCAAFVTYELPCKVAVCAYHHAKAAGPDNPSLPHSSNAYYQNQAIQSCNSKALFLRWLCLHNQAVWNYRLLFHTDWEFLGETC